MWNSRIKIITELFRNATKALRDIVEYSCKRHQNFQAIWALVRWKQTWASLREKEKKAAVFSARFTYHGPETETEHVRYSSMGNHKQTRKNRSCDLWGSFSALVDYPVLNITQFLKKTRLNARKEETTLVSVDQCFVSQCKMILKFESDQTISSHALYQKGKSLRTSQMNSLSHVEAMW